MKEIDKDVQAMGTDSIFMHSLSSKDAAAARQPRAK